MRPKRERAQEGVSVDLTPMIDVTFQLLVFFIVVTQIATKEHVDLRLPDAIVTNMAKDRGADFTIHIAPLTQRLSVSPADFGWFCNGRLQPATADEMRALLLEEAAEVDPDFGKSGIGADGISENFVLLRCDARAPAGEFGALIQLLAEARLYKIKIAVLKDRTVD